jgi:hypothetical protein
MAKIKSLDIISILNNIEQTRARQQVYDYLKDIFTRAYENEIIPKKEIMELLAKKFNMKIQFVKINNVSIFDYYLKTNSIP